MEVIKMKAADLKPYRKNPRINNDAAEYVAKSIKEFGFRFPILIDANKTIISGHTRLKAAELLGMEDVPVIMAEDLSREQADALRLVDNKSSEQASWELNTLNQELSKLANLFDMAEFDFKMPELNLNFNLSGEDSPETAAGSKEGNSATEGEEEAEGANWAEETQDKVENILNLGIAHYEGVGDFDMPGILPTYEVPEVDEWIGFNYAMSEKEPGNKGVHFFVDDYQFERIWNNPTKYIEILQRFKCVLAPDFSPYGNMPLATQIFNHYRKHWCARVWQDSGITVYPTIRASTDPRSQWFFLDGEPRNAVLAFSTMWSTLYTEETVAEFNTMVEKLKPSHLLIYGEATEFVKESGVPFTRIPSFAEKRWGDGEG